MKPELSIFDIIARTMNIAGIGNLLKQKKLGGKILLGNPNDFRLGINGTRLFLLASDTTFAYGLGVGLRTNTPIESFKLIFGLGDFAEGKVRIRFSTYISIGREFRFGDFIQL